MAIIWRHKTNKDWLVESSKLTHIGFEVIYSFDKDINNATETSRLPKDLKRHLEPVEVEVKRIVTIKGK